MKYLLLIILLVACSGMPIKSGHFERDSKHNYTLRMDPGINGADDAFLRAAYEICRIYHKSGINILSKQVMDPPQTPPWIEGRIACNGSRERALVDLYSSSTERFIIKKAEEGWSFILVPSL